MRSFETETLERDYAGKALGKISAWQKNEKTLYIPENYAVIFFRNGNNRLIYNTGDGNFPYVECENIYSCEIKTFETSSVYTCAVVTIETVDASVMLHGYFSNSLKTLISLLKKDFLNYKGKTDLNFYFNINDSESNLENYLRICKDFSEDVFGKVDIIVNFLRSPDEVISLPIKF